jgi:RND family efflux transporter MFP subunit
MIGLGVAGFLFWGKPQPQRKVATPSPSPSVDTVFAQPQPMALTVSTQGTVQPRRQIDLIAQVAGKVEQVADSFVEGGFFLADEVLVQLEQQDYRYATQRARARVADARQLLAIEKGRVRQAKREWRDLGDKDANELFLRKPQLASAQAALAAAEADFEQAELNLRRTAVGVPFDGRILQKFVDFGQYLAPGAPVARIYSTDAVEVRLPLTDRQVGLLDLSLRRDDAGQDGVAIPVQLSGRFGGVDWQWQGTITRTDASIDSRSRVMYAVAEIRDPFVPDANSGRPPLLIGQFVQARISGRRQDNAIALPRQALRPENTLWLVDDDQRLQVLPVTVLQSDDKQVLVKGEFDGPVEVIVSALNLFVPGMLVAPQATESQLGE